MIARLAQNGENDGRGRRHQLAMSWLEPGVLTHEQLVKDVEAGRPVGEELGEPAGIEIFKKSLDTLLRSRLHSSGNQGKYLRWRDSSTLPETQAASAA